MTLAVNIFSAVFGYEVIYMCISERKKRCIVEANVSVWQIFHWSFHQLPLKRSFLSLSETFLHEMHEWKCSLYLSLTHWQVLLFKDKYTSLVHLRRPSPAPNQSFLWKFVKFHNRVIAMKNSNCQTANEWSLHLVHCHATGIFNH